MIFALLLLLTRIVENTEARRHREERNSYIKVMKSTLKDTSFSDTDEICHVEHAAGLFSCNSRSPNEQAGGMFYLTN